MVEKRYVDYTVVNVVPDIPTFPQNLDEAMLINNHLCPFDKLPLFVNKSVNRMNVVVINDSVRPITDKEMKKFAEKFAFFTVIEKVAVLLLKTNVEVFLLYGGKELQKEHSDYFEDQGLFPSDSIKDGKAYLDIEKDKNVSQRVLVGLYCVSIVRTA